MFSYAKEVSQKKLVPLFPLITPPQTSRLGLITDDLHPTDLLKRGHMNGLLKKAVAGGISPITAIQVITINPATFYSLKHLGAIAPGCRADVIPELKLTDQGLFNVLDSKFVSLFVDDNNH